MGFEELRLRNCTRSAVPRSDSSELEALDLGFLPTVIKTKNSAKRFRERAFVHRSSQVQICTGLSHSELHESFVTCLFRELCNLQRLLIKLK